MPFNLAGLTLSALVLPDGILVVLWPLRSPTAISYLGAMLQQKLEVRSRFSGLLCLIMFKMVLNEVF